MAFELEVDDNAKEILEMINKLIISFTSKSKIVKKAIKVFQKKVASTIEKQEKDIILNEKKLQKSKVLNLQSRKQLFEMEFKINNLPSDIRI